MLDVFNTYTLLQINIYIYIYIFKITIKIYKISYH